MEALTADTTPASVAAETETPDAWQRKPKPPKTRAFRRYNPLMRLMKIPDTDKFISRNSPCICGSGLRYKRCCMKAWARRQAIIRGLDPTQYELGVYRIEECTVCWGASLRKLGPNDKVNLSRLKRMCPGCKRERMFVGADMTFSRAPDPDSAAPPPPLDKELAGMLAENTDTFYLQQHGIEAAGWTLHGKLRPMGEQRVVEMWAEIVVDGKRAVTPTFAKELDTDVHVTLGLGLRSLLDIIRQEKIKPTINWGKSDKPVDETFAESTELRQEISENIAAELGVELPKES